ncbi:MAG: SAM-dependent methyltransferase [Actinomycetota bacterium]
MSRPQPLAGSFRDPSGVVFRRDGILYRQVNAVHAPHYDRLGESGLYDALVKARLLVPHEEVGLSLALTSDAYKVIRPEPIGFVSYPYEWAFSQLKEAALATLKVQRLALDHGMSLRDASAYNVQFRGPDPVLIDTLSFEVLRAGEPWVAYRQFCQHLLAPLALMGYGDLRLGRLAALHIDGIPLDLAARLLPARARLRVGMLVHIFLHARSQRRHQDDDAAIRPGAGRFTRRAFEGLIGSLEKAVTGMRLGRAARHWVEYYARASHYSTRAMESKKALVERYIEELAPASVWDLGSNTGLFGRLAADRGIPAVCLEMDAACVEESYRRARAGREEHLLPLVVDLVNPSPALGWANEERMTIAERGPADLVLALALVHHLAIGNNVPLARVAGFLARLGPRLLIEFVPKEDEMVRRLLHNREDVFPDYTQDGFERAFKSSFDIAAVEPIEDSGRVLYLLTTRR